MVVFMVGLMEKVGKDGLFKSFWELKEVIKILESFKNMIVEQLLIGLFIFLIVEFEKLIWEKKFLDDIKKLQENFKKILDNVVIVEEEKMEVVFDVECKEDKFEGQLFVKVEWFSEILVFCQQCGGKFGVIFISVKGEVFFVLEFVFLNYFFKKIEFQFLEVKKFFSIVWKEMVLLVILLFEGIMVKIFEDRMDFFLVFIKGFI